WCWSVPVSPDVRCFAAMLDPRHASLDPPTDLRALLERHVRRGRGGGTLLDGAEAIGRAWACPATLYEGERFGAEGLVVCAEAARARPDAAEGAPAAPARAAACERIRGAPRLAARPAGGLARIHGPVVEGRGIVLEEHLTLGDGRRFRHHGPVDLRRLVEVV